MTGELQFVSWSRRGVGAQPIRGMADSRMLVENKVVAIQKAANCKSSAVKGLIVSLRLFCAHSVRKALSRSRNAPSSVLRHFCQCAKRISDRYCA